MKPKKRPAPARNGPRKAPAKPRTAVPRSKVVDPARHQRRTVPMLALIGVLVLGALGWSWSSQMTMRDIVVNGARHTPVDSLKALVPTDSNTAFFDIDTHAIAERAARFPWIESVEVSRAPDVTLRIDVIERTPVFLVVDEAGRPVHYLDRLGYRAPYVRGAAYDVPLLRGLDARYRVGESVADSVLLELADVVSRVDPDTDALLSEFALGADGNVTLRTTPKPGRGSIEVGLGAGDFANRLSRLQAFWDQEILARRETHVEWIDLRFDSQIITRERTLTQ